MDNNLVYYSPYLNKDCKFTIICWQWFDFNDYQITGFIAPSQLDIMKFATEGDTENDVLKFTDESKAISWMFKHIQYEHIDDEYKHTDNNDINRYLKPEYRSE